MARMGHDSKDAAIIYQHATSVADRAIARAVDDVIGAATAGSHGTLMARQPNAETDADDGDHDEAV